MKFFKPFEMPVAPVFPDLTVDIRDYGAQEGGKEKVTEAIAKAIEDCAKRGGGRVLIPAGEWLTGPIHLKDNIELHVAENAYVHFTTDFNDYLPVVFSALEGIRCYSPSPCVYAYRAKNIAVTGKGTLDGHGEGWWHMKKHQPGMEDLIVAGRTQRPVEQRVYDKEEYGVRPRMVQFVECETLLIEGVTVKNSPAWAVHPLWCKNYIVRGLTVLNPVSSPNTDGINIDASQRGLVEDCFISGGDDMICLKAGRDQDAWEVGIPCKDIEIRNCRSGECRGALTVGSEMSAGVQNAWIHDCQLNRMYDAICIKTMKGRRGIVENIDFENITLEEGAGAVVSVTMRYAGESLDDQSAPKENMPKLRNVSIVNLTCESADYGMKLVGEEGFEMENFYFKDITYRAARPIVIDGVKNLTMENFSIGLGKAPEPMVWE